MANVPEQWTVGRLLTWTADYLKRSGSESARLDAEVLLAHVRGCQRIELYTAFHEEVGEQVRADFRDLIRKRAQGTPVAYLVGQREFFSLSFLVTPDVLVPRPETEHLVTALIDAARARPADSRPPQIADVGTGSGILAICAAKHVPGSRVVATDIQPAALQIARQNVQRHHVEDAVTLVQCDLLCGVRSPPQFDFIISNPPYVSEDEFANLSREVREHEPRTALVAGATGMETLERLVDQAAERLVPGGWLMVEISPMLAERVQKQLTARDEFTQVQLKKDLAGHLRVALACRKAQEA